MFYYIEQGVPKDFADFIEKMEGMESKVNSPEDADIVFCMHDSKVSAPYRVLFYDDRAVFYKKDKMLAEVMLERNFHSSLWAFVKVMVDGNMAVVSRKWARKVVSGILQGMIALMEVEDKEGFSHSQRVARLAEKLGKALGFNEEELLKLREHAMLHDVGKIGIEQLMLYSPTRIRTFENIPQDHTILGSIYLSTIELLWDVIPTVRHHHERWDGKGYPDGLKGEEIPYFARIVSICDYYDNLTNFVTSEWLGGPKSKEEALEMIEKEAGKMFDPLLAKRFIEIMKGKENGKNKES